MRLVKPELNPPIVVEFTFEEADKLAEFLMDDVQWESHREVPLQSLWTVLSDGTGKHY